MTSVIASLTALQPQEIVVFLVALGGLFPLLLYFNNINNWFLIAYGFLLIGAITTNIENIILYDVFNFIEHSVGNLGAGIAFAIAAYMYRKQHSYRDHLDSPLTGIDDNGD